MDLRALEKSQPSDPLPPRHASPLAQPRRRVGPRHGHSRGHGCPTVAPSSPCRLFHPDLVSVAVAAHRADADSVRAQPPYPESLPPATAPTPLSTRPDASACLATTSPSEPPTRPPAPPRQTLAVAHPLSAPRPRLAAVVKVRLAATLTVRGDPEVVRCGARREPRLTLKASPRLNHLDPLAGRIPQSSARATESCETPSPEAIQGFLSSVFAHIAPLHRTPAVAGINAEARAAMPHPLMSHSRVWAEHSLIHRSPPDLRPRGGPTVSFLDGPPLLCGRKIGAPPSR